MNNIVIHTVAQAKAFILAIKAKIDSQTRSAAIKLNSSEELLLNRAKTVLQEAGQYAQTDQGMYLSVVKNRINGMYTTQWLPIRDGESTSESSLEALYAESLKALDEAKPVANVQGVVDLNI